MLNKKALPTLLLLIAAVAGIVSLTAVPARDVVRAPAAAHPLPEVGDDALRRWVGVHLDTVSTGGSSAPGSRSPADDAARSSGSWSIGGHVRLGTYGSLPDAPLVVTLYAGSEAVGEPLSEARIRADANGEFTWTTLEPAETVTVHVIPELEGHRAYASTRYVALGDPPPTDLQPRAYSLDTRITGHVLDGEGNGIADALVFSHLSEVRTDAEGRYALPMDSGYRAPTFRVLAAGFACELFAVGALRPGEMRGPDVVLRKDFAVEGRVVDASGAPIAGATVSTYPFDRMQTTTSADGRFRLGGLDPARQRTTIHARQDGLVSASQRIDAESLEEAPDTELEFVLTPGASLSGRVVTEKGRPVPNAAVSCNGYPNTSGPGIVRTDANGEFELTGIRKQANMLWARRRGWAAERIRLAIPQPDAALTDLEIVLKQGFVLTGRLLDDADRPIAGAEIRPEGVGINYRGIYVGDSAYSAADGRFALTELHDERFAVRVFAPGFATDEQIVEAGTDVVLRATRAGGIAGHVVDGATGLPVDSFVVRFVTPRLARGEERMSRFGTEWSGTGMSFVGTDGAWDSSPETLAVGAVTGVEISAAGYASTVVDHVVVTAAPRPEALRIELHAGATLRGVVVDATTGVPVSDARIRRFTEGDPRDTRRYLPDEDCETRTDGDGRFQLERVPFGTMFLVVDQTDLPLYIDGPLEVTASASTLERAIAVTSGGRVAGRFLDGEGRPLAQQKVTLYALETPVDDRPKYTTETDAEGAFEFENLSPGPHHLRGTVTNPGSSLTVGAGLLQLVEVEDGRTTELDLCPTGHATLTGTVEYDGDLPEDVTVTLRPKQAPAVWASRIVAAGVHDGSFSAPYLDAGEWSVNVFLQVDGELITGGTRVEVPAEGAAEVHLTLRAMRR